MNRNQEGTMDQLGSQSVERYNCVECVLRSQQKGYATIMTTDDENGEKFVMTDISNNRRFSVKPPENQELDIAGIIEILCGDNSEYIDVQRSETQAHAQANNPENESEKHVELSSSSSSLNISRKETKPVNSKRCNRRAKRMPKKRVVKQKPQFKKSVKKRSRNPEKWQKNESKKCRNSGLSYVSKKTVTKPDGTKECTKVIRDARKLLPACSAVKCRLKCSEKITEESRQKIFDKYWTMADLLKQRKYVLSCLSSIKPKYRYAINEANRSLNNAFHFTVGKEKIRVCKLFFINTLAINDRVIRTVLNKRDDLLESNIDSEKRGKHNKQRSLSHEIKEAAKLSDSIEVIPRSRTISEDFKEDIIIDLTSENAQPTEELNARTAENYKIYHSIFDCVDDKQDKPIEGKKRKRNPEKWLRNETKKCRNSGLSYVSKKIVSKSDGTKECIKVVRDARKILPACNATKCRLKCSAKISQETRQTIFDKYWSKADLLKQRLYVLSCMSTVIPKYRYAINEDHRSLNNAFHFSIGDENIRVCKTFFLNTLGITDRVIRTVQDKRDDLLEGNSNAEKRGKHKKPRRSDILQKGKAKKNPIEAVP